MAAGGVNKGLIQTWMENSWHYQEDMNRTIGNRRFDKLENEMNLIDKIKFIFEHCFGNKYLEIKKVEKMYNDVTDKLKRYFKASSEMHIAYTFINLLMKETYDERLYCVFVVKNHKFSGEEFIDMNSRIYKSWKEFNNENVLPKCYMIYPRGGFYAPTHNKLTDYVELTFEESQTCRKNNVDTLAGVTSTVAIGILLFNPVSAAITTGAIAASVLGGGVSALYSADRLVDKYKHEEISLKKPSTLLPVADFIISAAGTAAIGVTGGCKLLSTGSKGFAKSATVLRTANKLGNVCKIVTAANTVYSVVDVLSKLNAGALTKDAIKEFGRRLCFAFNIVVSENLLAKLIEYMSQFNAMDIINKLKNTGKEVVKLCNFVRNYVSSSDFNDLIDYLFPNLACIVNNIYRISFPIFYSSAVELISDLKLKGHTNPLHLFYNLITKLPQLFRDIDNYRNKCFEQVREIVDSKTYRAIKNRALNYGLEFDSNISPFTKSINFTIGIEDLVSDFMKLFSATENANNSKNCELVRNYLLAVTNKYFEHKHELKSHDYIHKKVLYIRDKFTSIYMSMMREHQIQYFLFTVGNGFDINKTEFFECYMNVKGGIEQHVFEQSMEALRELENQMDSDFERNYNENKPPEDKSVSNEVVYTFQLPKNTSLTEKVCCDTASKLIPHLEAEGKCVTFECHLDCFAILTSTDHSYKLVFYTLEKDELLDDGLLIYIRDVEKK